MREAVMLPAFLLLAIRRLGRSEYDCQSRRV